MDLDDVDMDQLRIVLPAAVFGLVFAGLLYLIYLVWGVWSFIAIIAGILLGAGMMPAMATPFFPSPPGKALKALVGRIYATIAMIVLRTPVLVKNDAGQYRYVRGTYSGDAVWFNTDGDTHAFQGARNRLVVFGRRALGLAWTPGHPMFRRIIERDGIETDGGEEATVVNMGKLHRILRGANDETVISRAEDDARAHYIGGDQGPGTLLLMMMVVLLIMLGYFTVYMAMG